ncbi:aldo/keto reductase [Chamaesiphon sp.]|uniref:aldo/keto reductase n=1 Tax=Chamaesiphon sp. TaxID=2814140 RepID=UPI0035948F82
MRYKLLGKSGLRVSELCLGTMTFGEDWGWGAPKDTSHQMFDAFVAAGGNFIDTANLYTNGSSEKIVGELIASDRDRFVVATKYSLTGQWQGDKNPNGAGNHRKNMMRSLEGSLKRLNTDYIDLLWLHAWDFTTPVEEVMRAFDDLVRQGKVMYIGISDTPAWIVSQANTLAQAHGWTQFIALQIEYSLIERTPERDLIPMATAFDLAVTPWSPLAGGVLSGKYAQNGDGKATSRGQNIPDRSFQIAQTVGEIAKELECSSAAVALAWILAQSPQMIPILGASKLEQLQDNLKCLDVTLSPEQLASLNRTSQIERGFPHDFLDSEMVRGNLFSGTYDSIAFR